MNMLVASLFVTAALAADPATVAGTWNMGLQHEHVIPTALVLEQQGKAVTGTIALPTQHIGQRIEVRLSGEFVDGTLKLSGTVENAKEPTTIQLSAKLQDDGSLEGTLGMHDHTVPWTAERLKERK